MKKLSIFLLIILISVTIISCKNETDIEKNEEPNETTTEKDIEKNDEIEESESQSNKKGITKGKIPYDITLKNLEGNTKSLSDYKGKVIFINFWASWCGPCKQEMPDFQKAYENIDNSSFEIFAVNAGEDKSTVKNFVDEYDYNFPIYLDEKAKYSKMYNVRAIPTTLIINKNYKIAKVHIGILTEKKINEFYKEFK
ncbi:MAG: TlpA family protein disulfide reductase [Bacillota bacterium]